MSEPTSFPPKYPMPKVVANSMISGSSAGLVAWLWNGFVGTPAMPAEVAAILAGLLGPIVAYLISWLPCPRPPVAALAAVVLMGALSACVGSASRPWDADWNPQSYAGITAVDAKWGDNCKLERIQVFQGKAGESFDVQADLNAGTVNWQGKGVLAFDGQKVRAEVEKAISSDVKDVAPGVVESVMTAIKGALGVP